MLGGFLFGSLALLGAAGVNAAQFARIERTHPPQGRFTSVDGLRLHYIERGEGPPVVLLHGNPGSTEDFIPLLNVLAKEHRAIAVDRPGHGYSERASASDMTPSDQAEAIHSALQQLGVDRPILVGHSWGGALSLVYALRFPDEVRGIVLVGTRAFHLDGPTDPLYRLLRMPVVGEVARWTVLPVLGRGVVEKRLRAAFAPDPAPEQYVQMARGMWLRPLQAEATVWDSENLQRELLNAAQRYGQIAVPVVILAGAEDKPERESIPLSQKITGAELRILPNTGHELHRTRLEVMMRAIKDVVARP